MGASREQQPDSTSPQRLEVLLADYQVCREEDRTLTSIQAGLFSVAIALIGLMAAAVTQTCQFSTSKSCIHTPDFVLAATPLIPIALAAYYAILGATAALRSYYMRGLESEIRKYVPGPIGELGELRPASFIGLSMEVVSLRRGGTAFRLLNFLILLVVIVIFGGFTADIGFHVGLTEQIAISVLYGAIAIILVWQVTLATVAGRGYFTRAAQRYVLGRGGTKLPFIRAQKVRRSSGKGRSLVSYLIFPRPEDWSKWLITPGVFLATAWPSGDFSQWPQFLVLWLVLEYLIYEARYQWNDIRGIADDREHTERQARGRLPQGPAGRPDKTRTAVLASMCVALLRLALALLAGWVAGVEEPVLALLATVFAIAIIYEALRAIQPKPAATAVSPVILAIWMVVGLGYGVRAGLGFSLGGFRTTDWKFIVGISCFVAYGVMFVLLNWVLEATSFCLLDTDDRWQEKHDVATKAHVMILLKYVPIILGQTIYPADGKHPAEPREGTVKHILQRHVRFLTPWNYALVTSVGLGGALGAGLARVYPIPVGVPVIVALSLAFSVLLAKGSSPIGRALVVAAGYIAITATAKVFCPVPYLVLAGAPWLMISMLYLLFRASCYRDLKNFGPELLSGLAALARSSLWFYLFLLKITIGKQTWDSGRFGEEAARRAKAISNKQADRRRPQISRRHGRSSAKSPDSR